MARIYTRTGDGGETSLFDGTRKPKADLRIDLFGDVDELNSWLGLCAAQLQDAASQQAGPGPVALQDLADTLYRLQADLLELGAILADPTRSTALAKPGSPPLPFSALSLEELIDRLDADLPPLRSFILPGGHKAAAALHVGRTVCRRVERRAVALQAREPLPGEVIAMLNRLSDFLFVAARYANRVLGVADVVWPGCQPAGEDDGS